MGVCMSDALCEQECLYVFVLFVNEHMCVIYVNIRDGHNSHNYAKILQDYTELHEERNP